MRDNRRNFLNLLDKTWPGLSKSFVEAMQQVRDRSAFAALEAAIRNNDVNAAFEALRMDRAALFKVDEAIEAAFRSGGDYQMAAVAVASSRLPQASRVVASFGGRNERAERLALELGSRLITEVVDDTRDLVAQVVRGGLEAGRNPRAVALDIVGRMEGGTRKGGLVGLHSGQAQYVQNMRGELANPERMANYFTRTRRDRRFDATVRKAMDTGRPLAQADIDKIAGRYSDRLLQTRGENIARTEALKALNAGRDEGLQQLIDRGDITAEQVMQTWDATEDMRTRSSHSAADGQTVPRGQPFIVGGYEMDFPGDTSRGAPARETINCRCYMAPKIDFFAGLE